MHIILHPISPKPVAIASASSAIAARLIARAFRLFAVALYRHCHDCESDGLMLCRSLDKTPKQNHLLMPMLFVHVVNLIALFAG
jgi:hypothetical protein